MKISYLLTITALMAGTISAPTWAEAEETTAQEMRQEVREAIDSIKAYSADKRDEAVQKARTALDDFDARMEKLEQNAKAKTDASMVMLREKRKELAARYDEMKESTKETWDAAKERFVSSYRDLEERFADTEKRNA